MQIWTSPVLYEEFNSLQPQKASSSGRVGVGDGCGGGNFHLNSQGDIQLFLTDRHACRKSA